MNLHDHLKSRDFNPDLYHCVMDEETMTLTVYLYTLSGKLVGYQHYKPLAEKKNCNPKDAKYFTYLTKAEHKHLDSSVAFGFDMFNWKDKTVFLVEGVFDACKFHNHGFNCLAVLANNPKPLRSMLNALGVTVVGVLDNDAAGRSLANFCDRVYYAPENTDPGDMTWDELVELMPNELNRF